MWRLTRRSLDETHALLTRDGVAFTGVVVEPLGDGRVELRSVVDGADTGPWHEPAFDGDQALIVEGSAFEEERLVNWSGQPFTGTEADIVGDTLRGLAEVVDGVHTPRSTRWHVDGSIAEIREPVPEMSANMVRRWPAGTAFGRPLPAPSEWAVSFGQSADPHAEYSRLKLSRTSAGQICEVGYSGAGHFDRLQQLSSTMDLGWYPVSVAAFAQLEFATHLTLEVGDDAAFERLLAGAGGLAAFASVEVLTARTFSLSPANVARLLALPVLREAHLREQERNQPAERNIRALALELLARRSDVIVTLDRVDLSRSSKLHLERNADGALSRLDYRAIKSGGTARALRPSEFADELDLMVDETHYGALRAAGVLDRLATVRVLNVWTSDLRPDTIRTFFALPELRELHLKEVTLRPPGENIGELVRQELVHRPDLMVTINTTVVGGG